MTSDAFVFMTEFAPSSVLKAARRLTLVHTLREQLPPPATDGECVA
jgi:hypothetical protein